MVHLQAAGLGDLIGLDGMEAPPVFGNIFKGLDDLEALPGYVYFSRDYAASQAPQGF